MTQRPIPPPGYIQLLSAKSGKPIHVNLERLCAYGKGNCDTGVSWLALQGRSSLMLVLDSMEDIALRIKTEQELR